jgi:transposase InsO family protein
VVISMDGRGRALENVFVERLWRTVKYEEVYLRDYADGWQAKKSLGRHLDFYRNERPHQALGYRAARCAVAPWAVRITLFVATCMVPAVVGDPLAEGPLDGRRPRHGECH